MADCGWREVVGVVTLLFAISCGRTVDRGDEGLAPHGGILTDASTVDSNASDADTLDSQSTVTPDTALSDADTDADADSDADSNASPPSAVLFGQVGGGRLNVVSDRDGNALVHWEFQAQVHFARWNAAAKTWLTPAPLKLTAATAFDPYGSGYPILVGDEIIADATTALATTVRRFDPKTNEWSSLQPTGFSGSFQFRNHLSMDGAGNLYGWWSPDGGLVDTRFWPPDGPAWRPIAALNRATCVVGAHDAGAWLWQENSGFGVRQFDVATASWSDETELIALRSAFDMHQLVVGPSGEALAATTRRDPTELTVEVHRYHPTQRVWNGPEIALRVAVDSDPNTLDGPISLLTDMRFHDFLVVPLPRSGAFDVTVVRRDASTGTWAVSRVFPGLVQSTGVELVADDSGNVYGVAPGVGLLHYSAATGRWTDTSVDMGSVKFAVSGNGAFALGMSSSWELVAYRHAGGAGNWRAANGLPRTTPEIGSNPYAIAPTGPNRALAVWPTRQLRDGALDGAIWAAFLE